MNFNEYILKMKNKLIYLNYSEKTSNMYIHYTYKFLIKTNKYCQHLTSEDFQNYLNNFIFSSISQKNQIISALKFFYEKILFKKYNKIDFSRPFKEKTLPKIIDNDFILNTLSNISNLKHKAILSLAYSVGLRVSEVINLKIEDIDSKRMIINIKQSKGKKDRIVPLSQPILELLRKYYLEFKPKEYLFNGQNSIKYTSGSCNKLVKHYLGNEFHFHLLRHSCFTNLLENGTDLRIIQKIAGHSNVKTTEIYTHVSTNILNKVKLPI